MSVLKKVLDTISKARAIQERAIPGGFRQVGKNVSTIGDMCLERYSGLCRVTYQGEHIETFRDNEASAIQGALFDKRNELRGSAKDAFLNSD